jgi:hypothetical protein
MLGWGNNTAQSTTGLNVTVTANSRNPASVTGVNWDVTAKDETGDGYMQSGIYELANELQISDDGSSWAGASTGIKYEGNGVVTGEEYDFWAQQLIDSDNEEPGVYSITITFTAEINV